MTCSTWKTVRLRDVLNFRRGHDLPKYDMQFGNIPVAGSNGIIGYHNEATKIKPCITIGRSGNVGTPYIYDECWAHNTVLYIDDYKGNHPKYLYYLLKTLNLGNYGGGSAVPTLNRNHIHPINIHYTSNFAEQERIANILGALDDKIELNNRINKNLEEQATALFRRWFVDFEFPDAQGKPYKSNGGKFVSSPLGEIPKDWKVGTPKDYFDISIGKTPPRKEQHWFTKNPQDIVWISIADMGNSGVYINNSSEYLTKEAIKKFNIVLIPHNTVILSFKLTVGRIAITNGVTSSNEAIVHFKTSEHSIVEYLYLYLKQYNFQSMGSTSSIATAVNSKMIKDMIILIPHKERIKQFHKIIFSIFEKIKAFQTENHHLAQLRDTLLPKLMNNEIKIN